jgi:hypothetical protein
VDAVLVNVRSTYTVLDSFMARRLAIQQRPDRPPLRCIGLARHATGAQPTIAQRAGRQDLQSHLA